MIQVLILCGGQSPEHEISLRSARNVLSALDRSAYTPILIGIDHLGGWNLLEEIPEGDSIIPTKPIWIDPSNHCLRNESHIIRPHVVFPVLHGPNGEDGAVQGLLQVLDLPYVGPNILGSSSAMDKAVAKSLLSDAGINVAPGVMLLDGDTYSFEEIEAKLGLPMFVKPANMGSSVGVHKVTTKAGFDDALKDAFRFDTKVIIEKMIHGRELECAVLGIIGEQKVTIPGEVRSAEEYSFDEKYSDASQTQLDIPATNLTPEITEKLKDTALKAMRALNCEILSRVDMFLTESGEIYVNEINTLPGFTSISMYPKLWGHEGISYSVLISELLQLAIKRHQKTKKLKRTRL